MDINKFIFIFVLYQAIKFILPFKVNYLYFNGSAVYISYNQLYTRVDQNIYDNELSDNEREEFEIGDLIFKQVHKLLIFKII